MIVLNLPRAICYLYYCSWELSWMGLINMAKLPWLILL